MADASLRVEASRILVGDRTITHGIGDGALLGLELGVTNLTGEPYTLNGSSISCWMELSPDRPAETLSLTPGGGGEGRVPSYLDVDHMKLESVTIPPFETRTAWVMFRGYRYPGSGVARKIVISFPDARGRRVQLVIADPAHGQLRWEMEPPGVTIGLGIQGTDLFGSALRGQGLASHLAVIGRVGPLFWDFCLNTRTLVQREGRLSTRTGGFMGLGICAHLTAPLVGWGAEPNPGRFGPYGGVEGQSMFGISKPGDEVTSAYGVFSLEGGLAVDFGNLSTAATPFPISFMGRALPHFTARVGYTHWFFLGGNSGGYTTTLRLSW